MSALAVLAPEIPRPRSVPSPQADPAQQLLVRFDRSGEIHWMNHAARAVLGATGSVVEVLTASRGAPALMSFPLGSQCLWVGLAAGTALSDLAGRVNRGLAEVYCRRGWHSLELLRARDLIQAHLVQTHFERTTRARLMRQAGIEISATLEAERGRLARELHDNAGQTLTGVLLNLELVERQLSSANTEALARLARSRELASSTLEQIRRISRELNPPQWKESDFRSAAERLVDTMSLRSRLAVEMEDVRPLDSLPPEVKTALYRALQEGLTNVVRHSGARRVRIQTRLFTDGAGLILQDDGKGFDPASLPALNGMGLASIRQRVGALGGRLEITSAAGRGCRLSIFVPVKPES